ARRLLATEPPFDTTTHLVMHEFRDIESAIRDVMVRRGFKPPKVGAHKAEIVAILDKYAIQQDNGIGELWLDFANKGAARSLHRQAHRNNLDFPREVGEEFEQSVAEVEQLLSGLFEQFRSNFSEVIERLDRLINSA